MGVGFRPTGVAPLNPACFWIEDPSRNRLAVNGISAINPTRFLEKILTYKKKIVSKSSEKYAQKILLNSEKKNEIKNYDNIFWKTFLTFKKKNLIIGSF